MSHGCLLRYINCTAYTVIYRVRRNLTCTDVSHVRYDFIMIASDSSAVALTYTKQTQFTTFMSHRCLIRTDIMYLYESPINNSKSQYNAGSSGLSLHISAISVKPLVSRVLASLSLIHRTKYLEPPDEYLDEPPDEYLDEPPDEYLDEPPDEYLDEPPDEYLDEPPDEYLDDPPDEYLDEPPDEYLDEPPDEYLDESPDEYLDEPPDEYLDEPPDEYLDEPPDEYLDEPPDGYLDQTTDDYLDQSPDDVYLNQARRNQLIDGWQFSE
ncbi:hypothetical protein J6590_083631 [Homalodisca vitripennis]|nr:hypothetical protein J6590_083631 [Homalodisca vitripennis]